MGMELECPCNNDLLLLWEAQAFSWTLSAVLYSSPSEYLHSSQPQSNLPSLRLSTQPLLIGRDRKELWYLRSECNNRCSEGKWREFTTEIIVNQHFPD